MPHPADPTQITQSSWSAVRRGTAVADLAPRGLLAFRGPDSLKFLQGQTSNDVLALDVGQGCPLIFANPKGGVLADATCFRTEEGALLEMERDRAEFLTGHLGRYLLLSDAELTDLSDTSPAFVHTGLDVAPLTAHKRGDTWFFGLRRLGRVGCTLVLGEPPAGDLVAAEVLETIRIEEGVPRYGYELHADGLPQNALLHDHVSFEKGCFTGQEPIARLHYRGKPARELRGLVFAPDCGVPARGAPVTSEGREVGAVTSSTWSPGLQQPIAMAYLKRKAWTVDEVMVGGDSAQVRKLPLYPDS